MTNDNREQYVKLYADYRLHGAVKLQAEAFERGFRSICGERVTFALCCLVSVCASAGSWLSPFL